MSAQAFEIVSGTQTANGNSSHFKFDTLTMAAVGIDVTAVSGTSPTFDVWLQGSDEDSANPSTWYDLPYDQQLTENDVSTDQTANTNKRNINGTSSITAIAKAIAIYKHLGVKWIRLKWKIGGTSPQFTFSGNIIGK